MATSAPKLWSPLTVVAAIAAAISAQMAWLHMVAVWSLGEICGRGPTLHCAWCTAAVGFAGLAVLSARSTTRRRTRQRVRAA